MLTQMDLYKDGRRIYKVNVDRLCGYLVWMSDMDVLSGCVVWMCFVDV